MKQSIIVISLFTITSIFIGCLGTESVSVDSTLSSATGNSVAELSSIESGTSSSVMHPSSSITPNLESSINIAPSSATTPSSAEIPQSSAEPTISSQETTQSSVEPTISSEVTTQSSVEPTISSEETTQSSAEPTISSEVTAPSSSTIELSSEAVTVSSATTSPALIKIEAESYATMSGVEIETNTSVGFFDGGDWIQYNGVNFGTGAKSIVLNVAGEASGGVIELRLGSQSGTLIGSLTMTATTGWYDFNDQITGITETSGIHDLFLVGVGGDGVANIDWFQLSNADAPTAPAAPTALVLNVLGDNVINAAWTDNSDDETGFNVYWSKSSVKPATPNLTVGANVLALEITNLSAGSTYNVWVSAINGALQSDVTTASATTTGTAPTGGTITAISLNIFAHTSMPNGTAGAAPQYAAYINGLDADVVGIQEGVLDWKIYIPLPTDYTPANHIGDALGACWDQRYQIFVNTCRGNSFVSNRRFDLADGPNATRTGESAVISKNGFEYVMVGIHWDHESLTARQTSAVQTADEINSYGNQPTILVGDFNTNCASAEPNVTKASAGLDLIYNGGIDCIFTKNFTGTGNTFNADPSDHPGVVATFTSN